MVEYRSTKNQNRISIKKYVSYQKYRLKKYLIFSLDEVDFDIEVLSFIGGFVIRHL